MSQGNEKNTEKSGRYHLNLSRSRSPRAFRDKENLWEDDLERMYRLIRRQISNLKSIEEEARKDYRELRPDDRPHLSIAIFGPSGSGKSSLLRTLADDVSRQYGGIWKRLAKGTKIASLPVMDPTTWSEIDQYLYAFLASALEEERKHQEQKEQGPAQGLSRVQLAFQEVNEYLRVVDDPGLPGEHDPLGQSLQKLERHTSGLRLREALGTFIEQLAKELAVEIILLPVDDLDMAPEHLIRSLQDYQSYLTQPQLVPVFTFTDRLPEELIEAHYNRRLKETTKRGPVHAGTERLNISETLAVQFLARCFPVRNRIRLGPAPGRVQRAFFTVPSHSYGRRSTDAGQVAKPDQLSALELLTFSSFLLFGHPDKEDAHRVRASLRPSTLRRQFQVIDAMSDCHLNAFHLPQIAEMANPSLTLDELAKLASHREAHMSGEYLSDKIHLKEVCLPDNTLLPLERRKGYEALALHLRSLDIGATWANIFNGAVWSLLNVHRDTLRELGLYLEDLYSWSPKELRSVVLNNILARDQIVRRTVVDRWFNRTDYRRSQVLSLLAANVFRPWMPGEEPYGDDEPALRQRLELEEKFTTKEISYLDQEWDQEWNSEKKKNNLIKMRLAFPATQGFLWFLNVTLGFYLPQVLARNWSSAIPSDEPLRSRMGGNGWDLYHSPINAIRVADARQEVFSFGMMFLDARGYRQAVQEPNKSAEEERDIETLDDCLLLRLWSCYGYSRGRLWSALSFWRGLSFIGQTLKLAMKHKGKFENPLETIESKGDDAPDGDFPCDLQKDFERLIRSHCLAGLVPGALLDRTTDERRLNQGFPPWNPSVYSSAITKLSKKLIHWIHESWEDCILPLPAGNVQISWSDCFLRRIHGEYILGSLWPQMNAAYLEEQDRYEDFRKRAHERASGSRDEAKNLQAEESGYKNIEFLWTAALGLAAWSDLLLEYWRGCPPVLKLLLSCRTCLASSPPPSSPRFFRRGAGLCRSPSRFTTASG